MYLYAPFRDKLGVKVYLLKRYHWQLSYIFTRESSYHPWCEQLFKIHFQQIYAFTIYSFGNWENKNIDDSSCTTQIFIQSNAL